MRGRQPLARGRPMTRAAAAAVAAQVDAQPKSQRKSQRKTPLEESKERRAHALASLQDARAGHSHSKSLRKQPTKVIQSSSSDEDEDEEVEEDFAVRKRINTGTKRTRAQSQRSTKGTRLIANHRDYGSEKEEDAWNLVESDNGLSDFIASEKERSSEESHDFATSSSLDVVDEDEDEDEFLENPENTKRKRLCRPLTGREKKVNRDTLLGQCSDLKDLKDLEDLEDSDVGRQSRKMSAVERIRTAQKAFTQRLEDVVNDSTTSSEKAMFTDEGEPSADTMSGYSSPMSSEVKQQQQEEDDEEEDGGSLGSFLDKSGNDEKLVGDKVFEILEAGMRGGMERASDSEIFARFLEYRLMCIVEPTYGDQVKSSKSHRAYYGQAVRKVEETVSAARDAVHSEAWRSCSKGLLEAMEWLPGAESEWSPVHMATSSIVYDWEAGELGSLGRCDACNRKKSHATRVITFKGKPHPPGEDDYWEDTFGNRRLSDAFLHASPVYKQRRRRWGRQGFQLGCASLNDNDNDNENDSEEKDEDECSDKPSPDMPFEDADRHHEMVKKEFHVGEHCSARLLLYHALFHYNRRLRARLKAEVKDELARSVAQNISKAPGDVADRILKDNSLTESLYHNYLHLLRLAEIYQFAGGEDARALKRAAKDPHKELRLVMEELYEGGEREESSIDWSSHPECDPVKESLSDHSLDDSLESPDACRTGDDRVVSSKRDLSSGAKFKKTIIDDDIDNVDTKHGNTDDKGRACTIDIRSFFNVF